jgi:hypothetical protein
MELVMESKKAANLGALLEQARQVKMSPADREAQRQSFAFGNANIENAHVTRETVRKQAELLQTPADGK